MSQQLTNALNTHLTAQQGQGTLYHALGGRIHDLTSPENAPLPLLVYQKITDPITRSMDNRRHQNATYQIDIYIAAEDGGDALGQIEQLLYDLLEQAEFQAAGHDRAVATCIIRDRRSVEDDALRSMSEYRLEASSAT